MSIKDSKARYLAEAVALIILAVGIWMTFFHSKGFVKTTGVVVETESELDSEGDIIYRPKVEYVVDGVTYREWLDASSSSVYEGKTLKIAYDPNNPSVIHSADGMGIFFLAAGGVLLIYLVAVGVKERMTGHE